MFIIVEQGKGDGDIGGKGGLGWLVGHQFGTLLNKTIKNNIQKNPYAPLLRLVVHIVTP